MFKASETTARGIKGTYKTTYGGIGLAYEMDGQIVRSGGNGFYSPVPDLAEFTPDGGDGYMAAVRGLCGGKR